MGLRLWLHVVALIGTAAIASEPTSDARRENYDQWRLALSRDGVANPVRIGLMPGYEIKIVRVAEPNEGSWINLAFDPKGRLIVSREDKGLLRFTLSEDRRSVAKVETVEDTLLECRGLLFAHDSLYVSANNSKGIYRLRDADGDDAFDEVKLLKTLDGGVGHGRNCLALGPDGRIYLACGNNVKVPNDVSPKSPYRNYGLDRLLPCVWNEFLFDADVTPPAGFVIRFDAEGKEWELFAGGFRNEYGLAFNEDGELFTYDADMEWDDGAPWYRPTCVMHVVSGGEYGWRQGTSVWPEFFADSLPRVVDVGLGSPTAVQFGTTSNFPEKYRRALFILDWAYGRILAVHMTPSGASYKGEVETFVKGKPLNVTGLAFGPDGAMYFTVGGRRTQSALYRVTYAGKTDSLASSAVDETSASLRKLRRALEDIHGDVATEQCELVARNLGHSDRWIRYAARTALERSPSARAYVAERKEPPPPAALLDHLFAVGRIGKKTDVKYNLVPARQRLLADPPPEERIACWRFLQVILSRSTADPETIDVEALSSHYPATTFAENYLLCELLVHLKSPDVIEKTLTLHEAAANQQEKLFYLFTLRHVKEGWTLDQRRAVLRGLKEAESFQGAQYMQQFIAFIRTDCLNTFTDAEREALAHEIAALGHSSEGDITTPARPAVKAWTFEELTPLLEHVNEGRNRRRGKELFVEALCAQCHRREQFGRAIGPDLDSAAAKFSIKDLLETIVVPSKVVEDKYRLLMLETDDGRMIVGQLVGGDAETLSLAGSPLEPTRIQRVRRTDIVSRTSSPVSLMPEGLLNSLTAEEILDLLAFLEFGSE